MAGKGLFDLFLDKIFDDKWKGRYGEKLTERELKLVQLFGRKGKVLRNVYVPKGNGETTELDLVFITQKGIFVFESKNYSGWIFGSEQDQYWTAVFPNKEKSRFYNPVKQNRTHIKYLSEYLNNEIPLFSIIVFSERCELKKITVESNDIKVIKRDKTYNAVRSFWNENPDVLTEDQVYAIHEKLKALTEVDQTVKAEHVENIQKKYSGKEIQSETFGWKVCPRCGKKLVIRTAKKGKNAGSKFYGCSGFPNCRYTENL